MICLLWYLFDPMIYFIADSAGKYVIYAAVFGANT